MTLAARVVRSSAFLAAVAAFCVAIYEVFFRYYAICDPGRAAMCVASSRLWQIASTEYGLKAFGLILLWTLAPCLGFIVAWFKASLLPGWTFLVIGTGFVAEALALTNENFGRGFGTYALPFLLLALLASMMGLVSRPRRRPINYGGRP